MWNFSADYCDVISKNAEKIIEKKGYPLEKHSVTTEDGYINTMYRIPHSKNNFDNIKKTPVFLCHGFACSSAEFTNQGHLAYFLADDGFDVWLPNTRGTTFSRKHVDLDPTIDAEKFWNFSWHEIGIYDIPAFIDYILEKTGFEKLFLIGHSQGATVYSVMMSERPEYNEKIALCCLLGPAIIFENLNSYPLKFLTNCLAPISEKIHKYLSLPVYEIPLVSLSRFTLSLSKRDTYFHQLMQYIFFLFAGHPNYDQITELDFSQFSMTTPNGASIRQAYHYCQIVKNKRFAKYDYGPEENLKIYGDQKPPLYDLSKITSPVAIFYAENDMYNTPKDVDLLEKMLGNVVHKQLIENQLFNHVDFLMAKDYFSLLYCHISKIMKDFNKNS